LPSITSSWNTAGFCGARATAASRWRSDSSVSPAALRGKGGARGACGTGAACCAGVGTNRSRSPIFHESSLGSAVEAAGTAAQREERVVGGALLGLQLLALALDELERRGPILGVEPRRRPQRVLQLHAGGEPRQELKLLLPRGALGVDAGAAVVERFDLRQQIARFVAGKVLLGDAGDVDLQDLRAAGLELDGGGVD